MIECDQGFGKIGHTSGAQRHRTLGAVKEPHAQQALGFLDLSREGRGRNAQCLSGARKVQVFRDADKTPDMSQFEKHGIDEFDNYLAILYQ
jgi:hypothetical protein